MQTKTSIFGSNRFYILCIFTTAFVLRIWGIHHGYPYSFYPDEAHFVKRALSFGSGDFNPHWFHKPAFLMYILFIEYGLFFIIGKIGGLWNSVNDFAVFYILNPGPFYILGRLLIVFFSIGTIWIVYITGKRAYDIRTGIFAALFLTVSFGHAIVSKDIKADIPCSFFTFFSVYYLIKFIKERERLPICLSAAIAGIGTATKTYSVVMLAPIILAIILGKNNKVFINVNNKLRLTLLCLIIYSLFFFICSPFNFIDPLGRKGTFQHFNSLSNKIEQVISGKKINNEHLEKNLSHKIINPEISINVYKRSILSFIHVLYQGLGIVIVSFFCLGVYYIIKEKNKISFIAILLYPFIFTILSIFVSPGYSEIRHQVVLYPFIAFIGSRGVAFLIKLIKLNEKVINVIIILLLLYPFYEISKYNNHISLPDSRNIAKQWIEKNIPNNSKILINENGPKLLNGFETLNKKIKVASNADPKGQFTAHYDKYLKYQLAASNKKDLISYDITKIRLPWWKEKEEKSGVYFLNSELDSDMGNPLKPVGVYDYDYYVKNNFQFIIVHSEAFDDFENEDSYLSLKFPSFHRFYSTLFNKASLVHEIKPDNKHAIGPIVKIYKLM